MIMDKKGVFIICEMSQTYEGKYDVAEKLVQAAIDAKADAIKFQIFKPYELAAKGYKYYDLFVSLELTSDQWGKLIDKALGK